MFKKYSSFTKNAFYVNGNVLSVYKHCICTYNIIYICTYITNIYMLNVAYLFKSIVHSKTKKKQDP